MGLGILITSLEHEDGFHCKVSLKTACELYTKLPIKLHTNLYNISCTHISVDIVKSICLVCAHFFLC